MTFHKSILLIALASSMRLLAQNAQLTGTISDPQQLAVGGATVTVVNKDTGSERRTQSNASGFYAIPALSPGQYEVSVQADGFEISNRSDVNLQVAQNARLDFELRLGQTGQKVTVEADASPINSTDAAVSTVVDQNLVEQLPLNGRSFNSLLELTPGFILTQSNLQAQGQFSVNGQRADANYFTIDGVSANTGIMTTRFGVGGTVPSFSATGGTSNLASVEAVEQFRVLTSSFAPKYGRKPGAQVVVTTRSGTNAFHGVLYEYFRNDVLDANDWFGNSKALPRPALRQNDFGGTFGGPIVKNKTFFFLSYEAFRVRQPQVDIAIVPSLSLRAVASPIVKPFLDSFPRPNGPILGDTKAEFDSSFSNPVTEDSVGLRIDHHLNDKLTLFGRFSFAPSSVPGREVASSGRPPNVIYSQDLGTTSLTAGTDWLISPRLINETRFNFSVSSAHSQYTTDNFGGAVPLNQQNLIGVAGNGKTLFDVGIGPGSHWYVDSGPEYNNHNYQYQVTDSVSWNRGNHSVKFGADWRRTRVDIGSFTKEILMYFDTVSAVQSGIATGLSVTGRQPPSILFTNNSLFAQDTWRVNPRLTLTYGLRWDINPAFAIESPYTPVAVLPYQSVANLTPAAPGTPVYHTPWHDLGPRFGAAYQIQRDPGHELVIRAGWGIFFDSGSAGTLGISGYPPYLSSLSYSNVALPFTTQQLTPPPLGASPPFTQLVQTSDPNISSPRVYQWNFALEKGIGDGQTIKATYIGAIGRALQQEKYYSQLNPTFSSLYLNDSSGTSDYHSLQVQYERKLRHGFQALASYTWSHSIDTASTQISFYPNNRGPSDFDVRHATSFALIYQFPTRVSHPVLRALLSDWSAQTIFRAHSAMPVDVKSGSVLILNAAEIQLRPDRVAGVPLYLSGSQYSGGQRINPAAFTNPAGAQGNLGRNAVLAYPAAQLDFALHRVFPVHERIRLEFRGEVFNILNHPNFGSPDASLADGPLFGTPTQMLGTSLSSSPAGVSPLYQVGGPRSIQAGVRVVF